MFTRPLVITDIGKTILFRAMQGEPFEFTCFRVGDGTLTGTETPETATVMKHVITDVGTDPTAQTGDIEISEYDVEEGENGKYFQLTGKFNNLTLQSQFDWTELGLFIKCTNPNAQDYDDEQLYAYGYDGSNPETIKTNEYGVAVEQTFTVIVAIGTAENITVNILHPQYAPMDQFENHINATGNVHSLSLQDIGAAPELHQHDASDIVNGILPPEHGGTGVNSISEFEMLLHTGSIIDYFDGSQVNGSTGEVTGQYHNKQDAVMGMFVGDGKKLKRINLGFTPRFVLVEFVDARLWKTSDYGGVNPYVIAPGMGITNTIHGSIDVTSSDVEDMILRSEIAAGVTDYGFAVGGKEAGRYFAFSTNYPGYMYFFIAIKETPIVIAEEKTILRTISRIVNVRKSKVYVNATDSTDSNGLPKKSVACVVLGGNQNAIARVIKETMPKNYSTYGSTEIAIKDAVSGEVPIKFSRPGSKFIYFYVYLRTYSGFDETSVKAAIRNELEAIVGEHGIGEPFETASCYARCYAATGSYANTFVITNILGSTTISSESEAQAPISGSIKIGWRERFVLQSSVENAVQFTITAS